MSTMCYRAAYFPQKHTPPPHEVYYSTSTTVVLAVTILTIAGDWGNQFASLSRTA